MEYKEEVIVIESNDTVRFCENIEDAMRQGYTFHGIPFVDQGGTGSKVVTSSICQIMVKHELRRAIQKGTDLRKHMQEIDKIRQMVADKNKAPFG